MPNYYNTGTVSVANGATTVTGSSVLWSDLLAGDTLELAGQRATIASVTDTTHLVLANAWSGTTQSGASYLVRFDAPSRFTSGYLAEQVRALVARAGVLEAARPNYEVQSLGDNTPPGSPVEGDMYVVGTSPTGVWAGQANNLALWTGSAYQFTAPESGTTVVSAATGTVSIWRGTGWGAYVTPSAFIAGLMDDTDASAALGTLGVSAFAKTILDDTDASAARTTLGVSNSFTNNTNGNSWRQPGGLQPCRSAALPLTYSNANRLTATWTFPQEFAGTVSIGFTVTNLGTLSGTDFANFEVTDAVTTTGATISLISNGAFASGDNCQVRAFAIGEYV